MANDLVVRNEDLDDVAWLKKELLPVLDNDELWHRLVRIVINRPVRLSYYFRKDEFDNFLCLIVIVGMLRNELIEWSKQHDH
jgi:hypothetical protein